MDPKIQKIKEKLLSEPLWTIKNTEKSLVAHVSDRRTSTKYRLTFLFISVDRYDPKQVSTYLGYVLQPTKKVFLAIQSRPFDLLTSLFRVDWVKIELCSE